MDKRIIDALTNAGLITTHVDHTEYDTVEDLMNDGMITFVNEKETVMEIARMFDNAIIVNDVNDPVETDVVEDDKDSGEEIIIITDEPTEQVIEETEVETEPVVEPEEAPVETVEVVEEPVEESKPKKKKTSKKAE